MRAKVIINPSSGHQNIRKNMKSIVEQLLSDITVRQAAMELLMKSSTA